MEEIKKIERYIERTKGRKNPAYDICVSEMMALIDECRTGKIFTTLRLAFDYGQAKGYRMAKAEAKK